MKRILISILFIASFVYGTNNKATVVGYVGKIEIKSGKKWTSLKIDSQIATNSIIRIKSSGDYVELLLPNNSIIKIIGSVEGPISKLIAKQPKSEKKEEKFAVVERTGVAAVRGGIGKPGAKKVEEVKKAKVKGYKGESRILLNNEWTNISYGMEIDYTNKILIKETNSFIRLEVEGNITNIYGPLEKTIEEILGGEK